jgi:ribonuclease P protein component
MKSKTVTLKKRTDFEHIIKRGKVASNNTFLIRFTNNSHNQLRYAIAANKKIFRTAVLRNKIKRQIRTFIQTIVEPTNKDMLIIVKNTYDTKTYQTNLGQFMNLYNKIR